METAVVLDIVLALLLAVTIGYCAAVHRRLGAMRAAQGEMQKVIDQFAAAAGKAESSVLGLKKAADGAAGSLTPKIETARVILGDLDMMIHRAGKLAKALDNRTAGTRRPASRSAETPRAGVPVPVKDPARSRSERELIRALKSAG